MKKARQAREEKVSSAEVTMRCEVNKLYSNYWIESVHLQVLWQQYDKIVKSNVWKRQDTQIVYVLPASRNCVKSEAVVVVVLSAADLKVGVCVLHL